jgi:atypical dual specificity phosphatase
MSSSTSTSTTLSERAFIQKFPRTSHLYDMGSTTSDDIKMSDKEAKAFLQKVVRNKWSLSVEEKIDGANIGFSLSDDQQILIQNRGHYVNSETAAQVRHQPNGTHTHTRKYFG